MTDLSQTQRPICATCGKPFRDMKTNIHLGVEDAEHKQHIFAAPEEKMSGRGGIYKGPSGEDLYGDGREVSAPDATKAGDTQREAFEKWFRALPDTFFGYDYETAWAAWRECTAQAARDKDAAVAAAIEQAAQLADQEGSVPESEGGNMVRRDACDNVATAIHALATPAQRDAQREAAKNMDWQQVVLNGGPPCFHLEKDGRFCGRAKLWTGHEIIHGFVSLADLLATSTNERSYDEGRADGLREAFEAACKTGLHGSRS
jgi:hypothetical protein